MCVCVCMYDVEYEYVMFIFIYNTHWGRVVAYGTCLFALYIHIVWNNRLLLFLCDAVFVVFVHAKKPVVMMTGLTL